MRSSHRSRRTWALLLLLGAAPAAAREGPRSPAEILEEYANIVVPSTSDGMTHSEFVKLIKERCGRKCELALELSAVAPDHPELPRLMRTRWTLLVNTMEDGAGALSETSAVLARPGKDGGELRKSALLVRAWAALRTPGIATYEERFRFVKEAIKANPARKAWCAGLLGELALRHVETSEKQRALCRMLCERYPRTESAGWARAHLRLLEGVGKPFALKFTNALDDVPVDIAVLGDRPVLVHVWSPYPGNGDEAIAGLKRLHEEHPGLALVGATLGPVKKERLRERCRELGVDWPQVWSADWESGWAWKKGVRSSSVCFLVGADGKLQAVSQSLAPIRRNLVRWRSMRAKRTDASRSR